MTKEEAATLVATARELWPGQWDVTEATFRVWHGVLGDVEYRVAVDAMLVMAATQKFYPRPGPGDVWQAVHHVPIPDVDEAWQTVRGYLSRSYPDLGVYQPGPEDQSLAAKAYRLAGGYGVVNDAKHGRRAFQRAWADVAQSHAEQAGRQLPQQIANRKQIGS